MGIPSELVIPFVVVVVATGYGEEIVVLADPGTEIGTGTAAATVTATVTLTVTLTVTVTVMVLGIENLRNAAENGAIASLLIRIPGHGTVTPSLSISLFLLPQLVVGVTRYYVYAHANR